jgi:hypothetical protein
MVLVLINRNLRLMRSPDARSRGRAKSLWDSLRMSLMSSFQSPTESVDSAIVCFFWTDSS